MLCIEKLKIDYDSDYDVLYYTLGDTSNSYGDENDNGIVFMKDINSDEIMGYTIFNFKKICIEKSETFRFLSSQLNITAAMQVCGIE